MSASPKSSSKSAGGALLTLDPPETLTFTLTADESVTPKCMLRLSNTSNAKVAFKVKTTHRHRYLVRPNQALLESGQSTEIEVVIQGKAVQEIFAEAQLAGAELPCQDKFLVQVLKVPDDFYYTVIEKPQKSQVTELQKMWDEVSKSDFTNKKLTSTFIYPYDFFSNMGASSSAAPSSSRKEDSYDAPPAVASAYAPSTSESDSKARGQFSSTASPGYGGGGASSSSDIAPEELTDLRTKYEKLLLFTVELTAARDRLQKDNDKLNKEVKAFKAATSSRKSTDPSDGLRQRPGKGADGADADNASDDVSTVQKGGSGGFTLVHLIIVAIACFLFGRLLQDYTSGH